MKSEKEELIENVIIWYRNNVPMMTSKSAKELTKEYLSINSEAQIETPNVNNNEGKKEELLCSESYDIWTNCEAYNTDFCRNHCDYRAK